MLQAIQVKFLGPTNTRGSRYKAIAAAGSLTIESDHALNPEDNARMAARALVEKLEWNGVNYGGLAGGVLADGTYAFVMLDKR